MGGQNNRNISKYNPSLSPAVNTSNISVTLSDVLINGRFKVNTLIKGVRIEHDTESHHEHVELYMVVFS